MKLISIIKTTLAALTLTASIAQASIIVDFEPSTTDISVGDSFTVDVFATTEDALFDSFLGFDIGFDFDGAVVSLDSSLSVLGSDFTAPFAMFYDVAGFANSFPVAVSGADILLATLAFTATSAGNLILNVDAGSFSSFTSIPFSSTGVNLTVSDVEVSGPTTLGLLGLALLSIVGLRRKA